MTVTCILISEKEKKTLLIEEAFCERVAISFQIDCQGHGEMNQGPKGSANLLAC